MFIKFRTLSNAVRQNGNFSVQILKTKNFFQQLSLLTKIKVPLYRNKTLLCFLWKYLFTVLTSCLFRFKFSAWNSLPFNYHNFHRVSVELPANFVFPKILSSGIWSRYKNLHELALQKGKLGELHISCLMT